jgi:imidazolonepropionase-like amidohydrolase
VREPRTTDYGKVQAGRVADLVILRANPLEDIANTRTIAGVVADGRYWSQADVERLREQLRKAAAAR